jgi:hypothetical protein
MDVFPGSFFINRLVDSRTLLIVAVWRSPSFGASSVPAAGSL